MPSSRILAEIRPRLYLLSNQRQNELITKARRKGGLNASNVCSSWPASRIFICERATASERRIFTEACQLAVAHDVGRLDTT